MKRLMIAIAAALLTLIGSAAPAAAQSTVYVIRHLEKGTGDDPSLTPQGAAQAQALAELLAGDGIKAVFATRTRRAQETGAPLAARAGVPVSLYDPRDGQGLIEAVTAVEGPVLIVGHSNTVPDIVVAFGGARPAPLAEDAYGTLYVVARGKPVREVRVSSE